MNMSTSTSIRTRTSTSTSSSTSTRARIRMRCHLLRPRAKISQSRFGIKRLGVIQVLAVAAGSCSRGVLLSLRNKRIQRQAVATQQL